MKYVQNKSHHSKYKEEWRWSDGRVEGKRVAEKRWAFKEERDLATALEKDKQKKQNQQGQEGFKKKKKDKSELLENGEYQSNTGLLGCNTNTTAQGFLVYTMEGEDEW